MANTYDYPGNLSTNTCILHDFVDIAYIVCTGATPTSAEKSSNIQEANSRKRILARLKNTEQQFRQASILVALDSEKLELFTFYKTVDIVKDQNQKTILTKFTQVLKLNHCTLAYKGACKVVDILKPDASRIYKLFTTAVLSSIRLHPPQGTKLVRISINVYIVRSAITESKYHYNADEPQNHYALQKVHLQITPSGQLLLVVQKASWPTLFHLTDLLIPRKSNLLNRDNVTCYLVPTGQLAKYRSGWIGSRAMARYELENCRGTPQPNIRHRVRCIEKTQEWIMSRIGSSNMLNMENMWIEVLIPALVQADNQEGDERELIWKTIYWPAQLSYVFSTTNQMHTEVLKSITTHDPLKAAEDWLLSGAPQAQANWNELQEAPQAYQDTEDRLFDDDVHFGSPQQFMSFPLQGIPNSQTVYPTPSDVMTAQPTPGFTTVDGMAQTPATVQHLHSNIHLSSPLANMTDTQPNPSTDPAISNFLSHSEEEDLFEEMDDQKLGTTSFADEPNWDFFDRDSPDDTFKAEPPSKSKSDEPLVDASMSPTDNHAIDTQNQSMEAPPDVASFENTAESGARSNPIVVSSPQNIIAFPIGADSQSVNIPDNLDSNDDYERMEGLSQAITQLGKRRRSSLYDVEIGEKQERDLKYSANGKYWFDSKKQSNVPNVDSSLARRLSSNSSSSYSSSRSQSITDEDEIPLKAQKPWAQYNADSTSNHRREEVDDQFNVTECDAEIDLLLQLVSMATGEEPFTSAMLENHSTRMPLFEDSDRSSLVVQIINEHIAQSALFGTVEALSLPDMTQSSIQELSFDNAGSNSFLNNAALGDLVALQPAGTQVKSGSKIMQLDHGRLCLEQMDNVITADLSILRYWQLLNLQPLHGKKDVLAICIHPDNDYYTEGCRSFLRRVGETYNSCNLGTHNEADLPDTVEAGLASWPSWPDRSHLLSLCQNIGSALAEHDGDQTCAIIYMVIPDDDMAQSYTICDAFVELNEAFVESRISLKGDVALQLIPGSFMANPETPVVPKEEQYVNLALEVYSRVSAAEGMILPAISASAFCLDKPAQPFIQFELDSKVVSPLQRHGTCCHLAYSVSSDEKWLVATWSDGTGTMALTMAYYLAGKGERNTPSRLEVLKHLSKTSTQLMNHQKSKWWLAVAKTGMYQVEEFQEWLYLCGQLSEEQNLLTRVALLSVELQPRICPLSTGGVARQAPPPSQVANASITPVTTPQATMSPDQAVPFTPTTNTNIATMAQTPPDSNMEATGDHEIYLVDPLEDSWMVTLPFGVNQSNGLDVRPALASGFLLKRVHAENKGANDITALGVNLIAVTRKPAAPLTPQEREQVLQEILTQYRGLHTLAAAKGLVNPSKNCVPWHVASSFKGANLLQSILS